MCVLILRKFNVRMFKYKFPSYPLNFKRAFCTEKEDNFIKTFYSIPIERIRNFSIIAHIDHGKSTLSDRILEFAGVIEKNSGKQVLDKLQVEKERGITVKAQSASLIYYYEDKPYLLNLIDTPGHVDFSSEVSRSLAVCQGVVLLIDANSGVQAQTVANFSLASSRNLNIIPVINKIDLKGANPERVIDQLKSLFKINEKEVLKISAKLGLGIADVLNAIIEKIPMPEVDRSSPLQALVFDSWYDKYRGALSLVYLSSGSIKVGDNITSHATKKKYEVKSLSVLRVKEVNVNEITAGQVGLIACNMRNSKESIVGDTFYLSSSTMPALPQFEPSKPMVFAGIYPTDQSQHGDLRKAIEKLILNDPAVSLEIDSSPALGHGWRLGFLGLLHLEVFSQRLQQEYGTEPILTAPSVTYKIKLKNPVKNKENIINVNNPAYFPEQIKIEETFEPLVLGTIITPNEYLGAIISLCVERRGKQLSSSNIDNDRIMLQYSLPLCEIIVDFHDALKTITSGYASFDYENYGYEPSSLVKLNILLNGTVIDELSHIIHSTKAQTFARKLVLRLKDLIPRQMVLIAIQAIVNGKILARENIKPFRKDVTAKLYGGDVTRRKKLLAQQAAGKKKMRMIANISVPKSTFIDVLKNN